MSSVSRRWSRSWWRDVSSLRRAGGGLSPVSILLHGPDDLLTPRVTRGVPPSLCLYRFTVARRTGLPYE